jgi:hypothetical protein
MEFPLIPWKVFLDALQHQQPSTLEPWLRRWGFTNEGVIMESSAWQEIVGHSDNGAANHEAVQA